ncbi:MAG: hypothetical protein K2G39_12245, partial [Lachnospiraceae bacterium]|nr:hypothetical protein [Lachnospiraceae bacterium]
SHTPPFSTYLNTKVLQKKHQNVNKCGGRAFGRRKTQAGRQAAALTGVQDSSVNWTKKLSMGCSYGKL